jgi:hypothetical protein
VRDEVIIPEYEGSLMTGRMIQKYYPAQGILKVLLASTVARRLLVIQDPNVHRR